MSKPKLHFVNGNRTRETEAVCGRDYSLGCWTSEARVCSQPGWGVNFGPELCKDCKKWLEKNDPEILEMWRGALELQKIHMSKLNEVDDEGRAHTG